MSAEMWRENQKQLLGIDDEQLGALLEIVGRAQILRLGVDYYDLAKIVRGLQSGETLINKFGLDTTGGAN
jgi:hypothetical protein